MNVVEGGEGLWYMDPLSCLYSAFGTALLARGIDPLLSLGRNCRFDLKLDDEPREEFYRVPRSPEGVLDDIAPRLGFTSAWHEASDITAVDQAVGRFGTVLVAVDNYHLPFRPAYRDVHAAHLVIVSGRRVTPGGLEFLVQDAQPPAFGDWLGADHLSRAAFSANPADEQDAFFSDAPIAGRYLTFSTNVAVPRLADVALLQSALESNVLSWHAVPSPGGNRIEGRAALETLVDSLSHSAATTLRSLYTAGWSPQAEAYLHARLCARLGAGWEDFQLRDLARASRDVSLAWTDMRLIGAYPPPEADLARIVKRSGSRLRGAYDRAADAASRWLTTSGANS